MAGCDVKGFGRRFLAAQQHQPFLAERTLRSERGGCLCREGDGRREVFLGAGGCWGPVLAVAAGGQGPIHVVDEVAGVAVGRVDDA